jgi:hypothetical protein
MPSRRKISDLKNRWVELNHLLQADNGSLSNIEVASSEELPTMIVCIVADIQNRRAVEND